jgi:hypothetical protein
MHARATSEPLCVSRPVKSSHQTSSHVGIPHLASNRSKSHFCIRNVDFPSSPELKSQGAGTIYLEVFHLCLLFISIFLYFYISIFLYFFTSLFLYYFVSFLLYVVFIDCFIYLLFYLYIYIHSLFTINFYESSHYYLCSSVLLLIL